MRKILLGALGAAAATFATAGNAAITFDISGNSGSFYDDQVTCPVGATAPCAFTSSGVFTAPAGATLVSASITSNATTTNPTDPTNLNFSSVALNGTSMFTLTPTGQFEFGTLSQAALLAGVNANSLVVQGTTFGDAAFSGTLTFAQAPGAVPEAGTWAMMLMGFAGAGFALRRTKRRNSLLQIA